MSGINMARTIKKIEPPRPLKSNMGSIQTRNSLLDIKITSVEDLVVLTESVAYQISQGSYDRCLQSNISSMYQHLKIFGAQLEMSAKDLLDRSFAIFRNGCQDDKLDKRSRTHLLELVELRAKHWQCDENMNLYYKKSGHIEALRTLPVDSLVLNDNLQLNTPAADTLPLLGPGEIIKTSGKFTKPTKIPGKNYSKDEVVIRNSDSGKVMGIKGRRVHMIEELSDTIISFQRVSPGAKERLVQITGSNEENVNHAKHLIGDTIRRNASPVRLTHIGSSIVTATSAGFRGSASSLNSSASDESPHPITVRDSAVSSHKTLLHSLSTNDAALRDYQHTVAVGDHSIKIKGTNPEIVRTAKLVLDEYFANIKGEFEQTVEGSGDFFTLSRSLPHQDLFSGMVSGSVSSQGAHALRSTLTEEYNGLGVNDDVFIDTKTASGGDEEKIKYSYDSILEFSESPLSKKAPLCIENFPAELQRKACLDFNAEIYRAKIIARGQTSAITNAEDIPDSPEPE